MEFPAVIEKLMMRHNANYWKSGMRCPLLALGSYRLMMNRSCIMEHIFWGVGATLNQSFEREHGVETKLLNEKNS